MRPRARPKRIACISLLFAFGACSDEECRFSSECGSGRTCVDNQCVGTPTGRPNIPHDAGPVVRRDAGVDGGEDAADGAVMMDTGTSTDADGGGSDGGDGGTSDGSVS